MALTTSGFENLGVGTDGVTSMSETLELAKAAEALGYHSFWLSEGYHSRSAIVRATLIAAVPNGWHKQPQFTQAKISRDRAERLGAATDRRNLNHAQAH